MARKAALEALRVCGHALGQTPEIFVEGDVKETLPYVPMVRGTRKYLSASIEIEDSGFKLGLRGFSCTHLQVEFPFTFRSDW